MAEIRKNVKNIQQSGLLLAGVDVSKAKNAARPTQRHFVRNEDVLELVAYLSIDVPASFFKSGGITLKVNRMSAKKRAYRNMIGNVRSERA